MERVNCSVSGFCSSLFSGCFVFVGKFAHSRVVMEQRLDLPPRQLRLGHLDTVLVLAPTNCIKLFSLAQESELMN